MTLFQIITANWATPAERIGRLIRFHHPNAKPEEIDAALDEVVAHKSKVVTAGKPARFQARAIKAAWTDRL
jgi:hypothetical protein